MRVEFRLVVVAMIYILYSRSAVFLLVILRAYTHSSYRIASYRIDVSVPVSLNFCFQSVFQNRHNKQFICTISTTFGGEKNKKKLLFISVWCSVLTITKKHGLRFCFILQLFDRSVCVLASLYAIHASMHCVVYSL